MNNSVSSDVDHEIGLIVMEDALGELVMDDNTIGDRSSGRTNKLGLVLGAAGAVGTGALLMYFFDPERGRGRRAQLNDQISSKANHLACAAGKKARHLRNRAQGLAHDFGLLNARTERMSGV